MLLLNLLKCNFFQALKENVPFMAEISEAEKENHYVFHTLCDPTLDAGPGPSAAGL